MKNAIINLSVCLSDIPKEAMKKSDKNGKVYVALTISGKKEKDQFGNDIYAVIRQTKEQREAKEAKTYVGDGTYIDFANQRPESTEEMNTVSEGEKMPWELEDGEGF